LSQESFAFWRRTEGWLDRAFLWTASSLTIVAIATTMTGAVRWPVDGRSPGSTSRAVAAAKFAEGAHLAQQPLIAFAEPEPGYPVISPFGLRQLPWEEAGRLHKGVDIAAPEGAPILAAADGVVRAMGVDAGYGRFIEIAHTAGMSTLYGHLSAFEVQPGATVKAGQQIGRIGSTGSSTGSHLHFEVHDSEGRALNPEMYMGRRFMTRADLPPLEAATRMPPEVRIAYVSFIPSAKAAQLLERQGAEAAALEAQQAKIPSKAPVQIEASNSVPLLAPVLRPAAAPLGAVAPALPTATVGPVRPSGRFGPDGRIRAEAFPTG